MSLRDRTEGIVASHGVIRTPGLDSILKVCDAYGLDFEEIARLVATRNVARP